jgi:hypothetical protein
MQGLDSLILLLFYIYSRSNETTFGESHLFVEDLLGTAVFNRLTVFSDINTVKPVFNGHPWDLKNLVVTQRVVTGKDKW